MNETYSLKPVRNIKIISNTNIPILFYAQQNRVVLNLGFQQLPQKWTGFLGDKVVNGNQGVNERNNESNIIH